MKTITSATLLIGILAIFQPSSLIAAKPINQTFFGSKAIDGYDTVAYHTLGKPVKGSKSYSHEWKGANWLFSTPSNRDLFKADPTKYAPQYGGYCAWAAANNKIADADATLWDIYDGKLYLNYNTKTHNEWRLDKAGMVRRGNANWPSLLK